MSSIDRTVVRVVKQTDEPSERGYWLTQPPESRLAALEQIRQEYNQWRNHDQSGFQRVYRIIKQEIR